MWVTDVGEAHREDEKTIPSAWFRRKCGELSLEKNERMVTFLSGELVGEFSREDAVFIARVDT